MVALATVDQVNDLAESDPTDEARVLFLLAAASEAVRRYTGQTFTRETTTARLRVKGSRIRLPQRPVNEVAAVKTPAGLVLAEGATWSFDGLESVYVPCNVWVGLYAPPLLPVDMLDVTYDHGYDVIPADIVALVCGVVMRTIGTPAETGGLVSESITNYSYQRGSVASAGAVGLLAEEKRALDIFKRVGGNIRLGA